MGSFTREIKKVQWNALHFLTTPVIRWSIRSSECTRNKRDHKEHEEYVEDNFRNGRRARSYSREPKDSGNERYHQKC